MTLTEIETLTKGYAAAREHLAMLVRDLEQVLSEIKRRRLTSIRRAVADAAERENALRAAIAEANGLFEKPRTRIFEGIKVGYQKQPGSIEWDDDAAVCRLIEKHFPDQVDSLLVVKVKPSKDAIRNLSAADLARIGVRVEETGDKIIVKPVDGEIDKLVAALLADAVDEDFETDV